MHGRRPRGGEGNRTPVTGFASTSADLGQRSWSAALFFTSAFSETRKPPCPLAPLGAQREQPGSGTAACAGHWRRRRGVYPRWVRRDILDVMSKRLVDIDDELLDEATEVLGASTMKETVN